VNKLRGMTGSAARTLVAVEYGTTMPKFTALDADPAQLDEHEQNFVAMIRKCGWFGTQVAGDKDGPGFTYTTGFWLQFEFPEVVVFGLGRQVARDTLWHMYRQLEAGKSFGIGIREDEIFRNASAVLLPVSPQHYRNHLGWSRWFYGNDEFQCLQLIFPDASGQFPWEAVSEIVSAAPPDLTAGDWSGLRRH
jgi:hypothetical protein